MFQIMYRDKYLRGMDVCLRIVNTSEDADKYVETQCLDYIDAGHTIIVKETNMTRCECCCEEVDIVVECQGCGQMICIDCLNSRTGCCLDCDPDNEYADEYDEDDESWDEEWDDYIAEIEDEYDEDEEAPF